MAEATHQCEGLEASARAELIQLPRHGALKLREIALDLLVPEQVMGPVAPPDHQLEGSLVPYMSAYIAMNETTAMMIRFRL